MSEDISPTEADKVDSNTNSQSDATASTVDEGQKSNQQQQQEVSAATNDHTGDSSEITDELPNKREDTSLSNSQVPPEEEKSQVNNVTDDDKQLQVDSSEACKPVLDLQSSSTIGNNCSEKTDEQMSSQDNESRKRDCDPRKLVLWKDGVGYLPGSSLNFIIDEYGNLDMIDDAAAEKMRKEYREKELSNQSQCNTKNNCNSVTTDVTPSTNMDDLADGTLAAGHSICQNCGIRGLTSKFIRAGKFCSIECAKSSALTVKSLACGNNADATDDNYKKNSVQSAHRTLNNHLYKSGNNNASASSSDVNTNSSIHGESILKKQTNRYCALQSPRQSSKLVTRPKLNLNDANNEASKSKSNKRPIECSDIASNGKGHKSKHNKKSKLKHRQSLSIKSIESLVHENSISNLLDSNSITNDSEKLSLPSSPASSLVNITPRSALHQSIFTMKIQQHQQEPPLGWDKHSKNLANIISTIKPTDVLKWNSAKVGEFVNSIPGCADIGQCFMDEMIDGEAFLLLTQNDIVKVLNIKLGPAIKIHNTIILLRDTMEV